MDIFWNHTIHTMLCGFTRVGHLVFFLSLQGVIMAEEHVSQMAAASAGGDGLDLMRAMLMEELITTES